MQRRYLVKKAGTLLVAFGLFFSLSVFPEPISSEPSDNDIDSQISSTRNQLAGLKGKQAELQLELERTRADKNATLESKQLIEQQIHSMNNEISALNEYISSLGDNVSEMESEISRLEEDYAANYEKYKARVRAMYERGEVSYLEVILSSKSFSEIFNRIQYTSAVVAYDQRLMSELTGAIEKIRQNKADIETSISESEDAVHELQSVKNQQQEKQNELEAEISQLSEDEAELLRKEAEFDRAEYEYMSTINSLLDKKKVYSGEGFIWPLPGYSYVSSPFGYRRLFFNGHDYSGMHYAIDIPAPAGTPIVASSDGVVVLAGWVTTGGGLKIAIDHGSSISTNYNHLSSIAVSVGQSVKKGDVIGYVGMTGTASGNHLDFKIIRNGEALDPQLYVTPDNSPAEKSLS